jgi:hypothetical protein
MRVPVSTVHPLLLALRVVARRSRRRMSLRVSQPLCHNGSLLSSVQAVPNRAREYPVIGARPLTASVANTAIAVRLPGWRRSAGAAVTGVAARAVDVGASDLAAGAVVRRVGGSCSCPDSFLLSPQALTAPITTSTAMAPAMPLGVACWRTKANHCAMSYRPSRVTSLRKGQFPSVFTTPKSTISGPTLTARHIGGRHHAYRILAVDR